MATETRVYVVKNFDNPTPRLVRASNRPAALRHVMQSLLSARLATQDDLIDLMGRGVVPEVAGNEPEQGELI